MIRILIACCFLFWSGISLGQSKSKPVTKPAPSELKRMVAATGLPYRMVNDSMAVVPYGGENIASYNVIVQKISDLYIVYCNLTEALPGKINETKYKYLLQQNDHFDIIKIGMNSDDNTVYVRADIYKMGATITLLARVIRQVANVTNIIGGDLK
jgi:hypothetical protein